MKAALLVIDMSRGNFSTERRGGILLEGKDKQVQAINKLVDTFRETSSPIFWITQKYKRDLSDAHMLMRKNNRLENIEDTNDWKILEELNMSEEDNLVIKKRYSAFFNTELQNLLQKAVVDTLVVVGVNTHACVRTSSIDAYQYDYEVIWVEEGLNSSLPEFEASTRDYMVGGIVQMMNTEETIELLKKSV